jgi:hypothetical protein
MATVFIPTPQQLRQVLLDQILKAVDFASGKAPTPTKSDRIKPELGSAILTLNVNMAWLVAVASIEEEPIRTYT